MDWSVGQTSGQSSATKWRACDRSGSLLVPAGEEPVGLSSDHRRIIVGLSLDCRTSGSELP